MSENSKKFIPLGQFKGPRYWPTWIALAIMWLVAKSPMWLGIQLGKLIGKLSYHLARERRHICEVNLRLCFPELSDAQQRALVKKTFASTGIGIVETAMAWGRDKEDFRRLVKITGADNLQNALDEGKGVLLIGAHFSTLDLGGLLVSLDTDFDVTYRPNKNPLFDAAMFNGRQRLFGKVLDRKNVRGAMRSLRAGRILWYAPDQDYGAKYSVFAPFFGIPAATITGTSRFAQFNNSPVLLCSHYRNADNSGYDLHFGEPIENYPSGDDVNDATIMNKHIEEAIRKHPDQYLWLHKRFKTQAAGKSARPY